jgi:WD40 repeat protein
LIHISPNKLVDIVADTNVDLESESSDYGSCENKKEHSEGSPVSCLALSSNSHWVISSSFEKSVFFWDYNWSSTENMSVRKEKRMAPIFDDL